MRKSLMMAAVCAPLVGGPAHAQDPAAEIDRMFAWVTPGSPGCAVGVARNGEVVVDRVYGLADVERGVALTPRTPFDVGSVTKQFVAASILLLADEGSLALSDDVRAHIPELPDYGRVITLDHLLTHTSGVRDWTWLSSVTGARDDAFTLIVRQRGLNFAPGEEWSYSNSGYELLREVVARVSGQPIDEFMRARLFQPLGMRDTRYARDVREVPGAALAYEKQGGEWRPEMRLGNARGGGGVFSTAGDLLIWNEALTHGRLGAWVSEKMHEPARLANGRVLEYARGLFLDGEGDRQVVWHSGDAGGYSSTVVRLPGEGVSVALLCNAGEVADGGNHETGIVDLFVPPAAAASIAAAPTGAPVAPDLTGRAGLFFHEQTGEALRLGVDDGRLRVAGGPPLVTVDAGRFRNPRGRLVFMSQDEFELRFVTADQVEITSMEGRTSRYHRARPAAPTAAELAAYAGRYQTDEIGSLDIIAAGDALTGRLNGSPAVEFTPADPDVFQRGAMIVRFRRDAAGAVTGLELSNPVVRNARFPRRGDVPADAAPASAPASAPAESAGAPLSTYEGTYALQAPGGVLELRVWADAQGRLNGELVGRGQQTVFRPAGEHRFLHAENEGVWFQFTVRDGRATGATMGQGGRQLSGPRKP